jgi:hypothetical protein
MWVSRFVTGRGRGLAFSQIFEPALLHETTPVLDRECLSGWLRISLGEGEGCSTPHIRSAWLSGTTASTRK